MIWSFEQYTRNYPDEPFKNGYSLYFNEQEAYYKQVEEGRHLFAKYFDNLWMWEYKGKPPAVKRAAFITFS